MFSTRLRWYSNQSRLLNTPKTKNINMVLKKYLFSYLKNRVAETKLEKDTQRWSQGFGPSLLWQGTSRKLQQLGQEPLPIWGPSICKARIWAITLGPGIKFLKDNATILKVPLPCFEKLDGFSLFLKLHINLHLSI